MLSFRRSAWVACAFVVAPALHAQFNQQAGVLPGPTVWTEGVTTVDLDGDGDLDVVFANGSGFSSAGTPAAPTVLINTGTAAGNPVFADETATRLPAFTQNAKGVLAFDMESDGDMDLFFSNAFGKPQRLLRNNGGGFFSDVTASQFTTANMNSFGATAFDMDQDGDRDLALCDNTGTGLNNTGRPRLFENDGSGAFTEVTGTNLPPQTKSGQQNITAVDIDMDLDLDLVLDGLSTTQRLYINDGTGVFTLLDGVVPLGSSNVYETDWADLDNDGDVDAFYISLSGFNEGTAQNRLVDTGSLVFVGSTATLTGTNGQDDNEVLFIDDDNDGDLDPIVGSLGNNREKLYRNNGAFGFAFTTLFSAQTDSTLDLTCGDYDGDGAYDVITAQGESGNFLNRYYRNDGPSDTRAPTLVRSAVASDDPQFPFVILAMVTDATMDDNEQFVACTLDFTATPAAGAPVVGQSPMRYSGGSIYRGEIDTGLTPAELAGATVTYTITMVDGAGNSATTPVDTIGNCGASPYGFGEIQSAGTLAQIGTAGGPPSVGNPTFQITLTGGTPTSAGLLFTGSTQVAVNLSWGTLFVGGNVVRVSMVTNGAGQAAVPVAITPAMAGTTSTFQFAVRDPGDPGSLQHSNALAITWCP